MINLSWVFTYPIFPMLGSNCVAAAAGGVEVAAWIMPKAFRSKYSFLQVSSLIERASC
jgi:hypothetical protein